MKNFPECLRYNYYKLIISQTLNNNKCHAPFLLQTAVKCIVSVNKVTKNSTTMWNTVNQKQPTHNRPTIYLTLIQTQIL